MGVRSLRSSISISLAIHAFFILVCAVLLSQRSAQLPVRPLTWVELEPLPKHKRADSKDSTRKQIVQTETGKIQEKAPDDSFLGEKNQRVDRETVSKQRTTVMGKTQAAPQTFSGPKPLAKLALPILPNTREMAQEKQADGVQPEWATPGVRPQDFVRGMRESDRTALNTREFVYFGYYQRIRERLDRAWVPILRAKLLHYYRGGRQLASDMDYTTKLMVVLNGHGEIVRVQVMSESGTRDLDDAAIRAFNLAGPFPNPPRGIVDPNGEIQVPWEFILRT